MKNLMFVGYDADTTFHIFYALAQKYIPGKHSVLLIDIHMSTEWQQRVINKFAKKKKKTVVYCLGHKGVVLDSEVWPVLIPLGLVKETLLNLSYN